MWKIFKFTFWSDLDIQANCWILAQISIILTMRKHAMKVREVSFAADCQTKVVKCDCAANKKIEVKITVLPFGCILINIVHW